MHCVSLTTSLTKRMVIAIDTTRFRSNPDLMTASKEVLDEMRRCPPAPGFSKVEIPGQRENERVERLLAKDGGHMKLPQGIWSDIVDAAKSVGVESPMPRVEFVETCLSKM